MTDSFATQPIAPVNPVIGVRPIEVVASGQQATAAQTQLALLPAGTIVEGFVLTRDNQNNPILRTSIGDLQLQSEVFLKTGSQVIFRVDTTSASRARIVTIDGVEPDEYAAQAARGLSSDTVEPSPLPQTPTTAQPKPENNATLPALLLNKAATANPTNNPQIAALITTGQPLPENLQKLASGTALKVTVLDVQFPVATPEHAAPPAPPTQNAPVLPANAPAANAPASNTAPNTLPNAAPPAPTALPTALPANVPAAAPVIQTFAESLLNSMAPNAPAAQPSAQPLPSVQPLPLAVPTPIPQTSNVPIPSTPVVAQPTATPVATNQPAPAPSTTAAQPLPAAPTNPAAAPLALPASPVIAAPANLTTATAAPSAPANPATVATPPATTTTIPAAPQPTTAPTIARPPLQGLQAVVIGHEPDGGNVLHSALGTIKLFTPRPLPVGSSLTLDVKPDETIAQNSAIPVHDSATSPPLTPRSRDWPLLNDIAKPSASTTTAPPPIFLQIPVANSALASGLLSFMAAVKSGDVRQWLGTRALDKLNTDFPEIAARLKIDVEQMQDLWNNSPLQNWSSMLLPINVQGQIEHARLYIRDEETPENKAASNGGGGQRFIVEVNLSHLGDMQMDGFVQSKSAKQFDLVIRTSRAIEPTLANEIRGIFESAAHSTGYTGYLSFQRGEQHFVRPLAEMKTNPSDFHTILA